MWMVCAALAAATDAEFDARSQVNMMNKALQNNNPLRKDDINQYYDEIRRGVNETTTARSPITISDALRAWIALDSMVASQITTNGTRPIARPVGVTEMDARRRRALRIADHSESTYPTGKKKMNQRVVAKINELNEETTLTPPSNNHPSGLVEDIQDEWFDDGNDKWIDITQKINHEGLEELPSNEISINPTWSVEGAMVVFTQYVTLGIVSPLSAAIDAINDATFHVRSDERMHAAKYSDGANPIREAQDLEVPLSLKSPRGHTLFGKGSQAKARVQQYPIIHHGTMDHVLDVDSRRISDCNARAEQAVSQLGRVMEVDHPDRRGTRDAWRAVISAGAKQLTGIGRFGIGLMNLGGQMSHVIQQAKGLVGAISSIRSKSAAVMQAEASLISTSKPEDQGTGALRRGVLANAVTGAVCGTSKKLVSIVDALKKGRVPKELFSSVAELNNTMDMVKKKLLQPIKMQLMLDDPNLLMDYQASGYIRESKRKTEILAKAETTFNKGSLGHAWVQGDPGTVALTVPAEDQGKKEVELGIKGNLYRKYAVHKAHKSGMRDKFLTTVQSLVVKVQIPVTPSRTRPWLQLRPERELYKIASKPFIFREDHTIFQTTDTGTQSIVVSVKNKDLKNCKQLSGHNFLACPAEYVRERKVCEEGMLTNQIGMNCLSKFERWSEDKAYLRQVGRTTKYIAYIPEGKKLEIRCPSGGLQPWSPPTIKGYLEVRLQPYCVVRLDNLRKFVVTAMNEQRLIEPMGGGSVQEKIRKLIEKRNINWESFAKEANSPLHMRGTLETILEGAQSLTPLQIREYLFMQPKEFGLIVTSAVCLTVIIILAGTMVYIIRKRRAENEEKKDDTAPVTDQTTREICDLKRRLSKSEEHCRHMNKQMQEINRFREAISSDLFRQYLRAGNRSLGEGVTGRSARRPTREDEMANQIEMQPLM